MIGDMLMTRSQKRYTEEGKAVALAAYAANENNAARAAKFTGIPRQTILSWVNGTGVNETIAKNSSLKKGELADRLEALAHKLAEAMPEKIEEASLQQVATSLGIAVDKMQLLRSKPTEIIQDASLSDDQRADRIAEILQSARDRRNQRAAEDASERDASESGHMDPATRSANNGDGVAG